MEGPLVAKWYNQAIRKLLKQLQAIIPYQGTFEDEFLSPRWDLLVPGWYMNMYNYNACFFWSLSNPIIEGGFLQEYPEWTDSINDYFVYIYLYYIHQLRYI